MDMKLTEEQQQLQEAARRYMDEHCTMAFVREMEASELGFSREMWKQMAELGWLGIDLPDALGGLGLGALDQAILLRELGRHLCPSPFVPTVAIAGTAIARAGDAEQKRLIQQVVDGELVIAFAYQELTRFFDPGRVELEARREGDGWRLSGTKMFVEFAAAADRMLVVARTSGAREPGGGLTLFLVDAKAEGVSCKHAPTVARDRHYDVEFDGVRAPAGSVLGTVDEAWPVLDFALQKGALAFSAFTNGAAFELHEMATRFAKERVQFGRPIGQMQTIQGYLAQLIMEILGSDTLTMFTAFNMDRGRDVRGYVGKTKAFAGETVFRTMHIGSTIFGGMGYMEEVDSTLYLRRGKQYELMLGGTDYWYDVAADELLDPEEPVLLT